MSLVKAKAAAGFFCWDCGLPCTHLDDYVVHDEVWAESGCPPTDRERFVCLHIECLETRLGRELREEDLRNCPANYYTDRAGWLKNWASRKLEKLRERAKERASE